MDPAELRDDDTPEPSSADGPATTNSVSQATQLVELAERSGASLFHDDLGDGWIQVPVDDHQEHWACRSKASRSWLTHQHWKFNGKAGSSDTINTAMNVLEAKARFEGLEHSLHNRVARGDEDEIWYDLTDPSWRAVKITPAGWGIASKAGVLFRRYSHQRPQVVPRAGGDFHRVDRFLNIKRRAHQLLAKVYLVSCLVPDIAHPVPVFHGPQGAAKTTHLRIFRRLIDPSLTETLTAPRNISELVQQLSHHWMAYYDNLSSTPDWLSDALCRAVTGEGFSKRELYTNDDDVIYQFRRCCGLNGINIAATKADLLDRSLLFGLERIGKANRKTERGLWRDFERMRPYLVGAAFDTLSRALRLLPLIDLPQLERMADFNVWGCAIAEALGYSRQEFLDAFAENFDDRNEEIIASNPVATTVSVFMEQRSDWLGTPSELLDTLTQTAQALSINTKSRQWPQAANALTRRLNEVAANLAATGIAVAQRRVAAQREITLCCTREEDQNDQGDGDLRSDGNDDVSEVSSSISSPQSPLNSRVNDGSDGDDGISLASKGPEVEKATEPLLSPSSPGNTVTTVITVIPAKNTGKTCDDTGDDPPSEPSFRPTPTNGCDAGDPSPDGISPCRPTVDSDSDEEVFEI